MLLIEDIYRLTYGQHSIGIGIIAVLGLIAGICWMLARADWDNDRFDDFDMGI